MSSHCYAVRVPCFSLNRLNLCFCLKLQGEFYPLDSRVSRVISLFGVNSFEGKRLRGIRQLFGVALCLVNDLSRAALELIQFGLRQNSACHEYILEALDRVFVLPQFDFFTAAVAAGIGGLRMLRH